MANLTFVLSTDPLPLLYCVACAVVLYYALKSCAQMKGWVR